MKKRDFDKMIDRSVLQVGDNEPIHVRVAKRSFAEQTGKKIARVKTAGEIRFVKDQGPEQREIPKDFHFNQKYLKPLSKVLWSLSCSMGHLVSAQTQFTKIKAVNVSPDGKLGGKGYIQEIRDMRSNLSEAIETLSKTVDTIHDEIRGDHWQEATEALPEDDREEVEEMLDEAEEIVSDPEGYAEKEYQEEIEDD